ncbi:MAG: precorrin-6y C5,15-methyltransferase (decarboxylating) subunit CbiE [Bacteroidaceae bacterium]|nr:precorrin-6y C5,15-methyltransferase (decarboxylating) subunit CbiE [Bacteroidaceae bacterium]
MFQGECIIIGISDSRRQWLSPEVETVIARGHLFSGGRRHREIMAGHLPDNYEWIDITVPIADVFRQYEKVLNMEITGNKGAEDSEASSTNNRQAGNQNSQGIIIFASGDPLFYGFAATVMREWPKCKLRVYPSFNSLQTLAHRMHLPYQDMRVVSLTGRPWDKFDEAIINQEQLIGCLTDHVKTPQAISKRMAEYGYDNYEMTVGENLGNETEERVTRYAEGRSYSTPNCVILRRTALHPRPFGIPEQSFHLLDGRERMITKMPVRLLSLSMLELHNRHSLWDIGFCTGSISIEAKLQFPHLKITAFEVRPEGLQLMEANARQFGTPGITAVCGDFLDADLTPYAQPDAVFIGGHGGRLKEIMAKVLTALTPDGCMVMNSVSVQSREMFSDACRELGLNMQPPTRIAINDYNPIEILKCNRK